MNSYVSGLSARKLPISTRISDSCMASGAHALCGLCFRCQTRHRRGLRIPAEGKLPGTSLHQNPHRVSRHVCLWAENRAIHVRPARPGGRSLLLTRTGHAAQRDAAISCGDKLQQQMREGPLDFRSRNFHLTTHAIRSGQTTLPTQTSSARCAAHATSEIQEQRSTPHANLSS